MDQLRALVEAADKDKVDLMNQLEEERRSASVTQAGKKTQQSSKITLFSTGRWRTFSSVWRKLALPKETWR